MFVQNCGLLPNRRDRRNAISGDTPARPDRMPCSVWRLTPSRLDAAVTLKPAAGRISSPRISPECGGSKAGRCFDIIFPLSTVILKIDIDGFAVSPTERDTPRP